jgi:hypothetical protein
MWQSKKKKTKGEQREERKGGKDGKRRHKKYVRRKKRDLRTQKWSTNEKNIRTSPNAKAKCINAL